MISERRTDEVVAKWLGKQSYLDDLNSLDKELYKGLISTYKGLRRNIKNRV